MYRSDFYPEIEKIKQEVKSTTFEIEALDRIECLKVAEKALKHARKKQLTKRYKDDSDFHNTLSKLLDLIKKDD